MVVTRTGHCHPLAIADTTPPSPMQNHPLSRSMGNYFLSVDYGVNFRTTRPRSFRTRYDSDLRRLRERVSYEHRGELQSHICYEPLDPIIKQIIINRSKREINTFCFISFVRRFVRDITKIIREFSQYYYYKVSH